MALFLVAAGLIGAIGGGISAANTQKQICKQTDETYQQIATYSSAQQKIAAQLESYDSQLQSEIADQLDNLASINANLSAIQAEYKKDYQTLEAIVIITCVLIGLLLVAKRLGLLDF